MRIIGCCLLFAVLTGSVPGPLCGQDSSHGVAVDVGVGVVQPLKTLGTFDIGEGSLQATPMLLSEISVQLGRLPLKVYGLGALSWMSGVHVEETNCSGAGCLERSSDGNLFLFTAGMTVELPFRIAGAVAGASVGWGNKTYHDTGVYIVDCVGQSPICVPSHYFRRTRSESTLDLGIGVERSFGKLRVSVGGRDFASEYVQPDGTVVFQHDLLMHVGVVFGFW